MSDLMLYLPNEKDTLWLNRDDKRKIKINSFKKLDIFK
jgi:hypothetical protein